MKLKDSRTKKSKKKRGGTKRKYDDMNELYIDKNDLADTYFNMLIQPFSTKKYDLLLLKFHVDLLGYHINDDYTEINYNQRYTDDIETMYKTLNQVFLPHLLKKSERYYPNEIIEKYNNYITSVVLTIGGDMHEAFDEALASINNYIFIDKSNQYSCFLYKSWLTQLMNAIMDYSGTNVSIRDLEGNSKKEFDDETETVIDEFNKYVFFSNSLFIPTLNNWDSLIRLKSNISFGAFHRNESIFKDILYQFLVALLSMSSIEDIRNIFDHVSRSVYMKFKIPSKVVLIINCHGGIRVKNKNILKTKIPDNMKITKINSMPHGICDFSSSTKKKSIIEKTSMYLKKIGYNMENFNICDLFSVLKELHTNYHAKRGNPDYANRPNMEKTCKAIQNDETFKQFNINSGEVVLNKIYSVDKAKPFYQILIMNSIHGEDVEDQINLYDLFDSENVYFDKILHFLKENGVDEVYAFDFSCNSYDIDESSEDYNEIDTEIKKYKYGGKNS